MPEPPRRKRFQIHLSTATVLMIAAGGLICANVRIRYHGKENERIVLGWPLAWVEYWGMSGKDYSLIGFPMDIVVAALLLFAVWFMCELWIRRRAAMRT